MCTVTFMACRRGYALGMNRDEKRTRSTARPPSLHRLEGRTALYPSEPGGGTWVGVNDAGASIALVNWYSVSARVTAKAVSRGEIVKAALRADLPNRAGEALATVPLARVNPFRLIGVFAATREVVEWRWDLKRLERFNRPWQTSTWISSGFNEYRAQQIRARTFRNALEQSLAESTAWLRRLHRSHAPEAGPYSICMHRDDAATVSYTEIIVSKNLATMHYQPGPPCCRRLISTCAIQCQFQDLPPRTSENSLASL